MLPKSLPPGLLRKLLQYRLFVWCEPGLLQRHLFSGRLQLIGRAELLSVSELFGGGLE
jgi:hypothetical protein